MNSALRKTAVVLASTLVSWVVSSHASETLHDPTRPLSYTHQVEYAQQKLHLQAIFSSATQGFKAVINGQFYVQNDVLGQWKIIAIGEKTVRLRAGDTVKVLLLRDKVTQ